MVSATCMRSTDIKKKKAKKKEEKISEATSEEQAESDDGMNSYSFIGDYWIGKAQSNRGG